MKLFSTKSPDLKSFEARIESFLEDNGAAGAHFWNKGDSLEALFNLVRHTKKDLSEARSKIRRNQDDHDAAIHELRGKVREKISAIEHLEASHEKAIREIYEDNERVIKIMDRTHKDEKTKLQSDHDTAVATLQSEHDTVVATLKSEHDATEAFLRSEHETERNKLISQLLVNVDESHEWPDDKIKLRFGELHCLVDSMASPQRHELNFPPDGDVSKELDPTGFFQRGNARGRGHFLIKSTIWEIIREHFFWLQFGLGAFGPGDAHKSILKALSDWKALTSGDSSCTEDSDLSIFETDSLSNRWRCLTFQRIQSNRGDVHLDFRNMILQRRAQNIAESNARIMGYLSRVAALSNNIVSKEVETEVKRATELAEEIALQFGVHSCKLIWVRPDPAWNWDPAPGLIKCVQNSAGGTSQRTIVVCKGKSEG